MTRPVQSIAPNGDSVTDLAASAPPLGFTRAVRFHAAANGKPAPWMSIVDVAGEWGVCVRSVRRWQAAGLMPPRFKRSRWFMYLRAEIESLLTQGPRST